jgi:hypothetical protein
VLGSLHCACSVRTTPPLTDASQSGSRGAGTPAQPRLAAFGAAATGRNGIRPALARWDDVRCGPPNGFVVELFVAGTSVKIQNCFPGVVVTPRPAQPRYIATSLRKGARLCSIASGPTMRYRGTEFWMVQRIGKGRQLWRWSVSFDSNHSATGHAATEPEAMAEAERAIDRALAVKKIAGCAALGCNEKHLDDRFHETGSHGTGGLFVDSSYAVG